MGKKRKKQNWSVGDIFLIPLGDDTFSIGQVIAQEKEALNSVICVFLLTRIENADQKVSLDSKKVISALFTTPDLLDSGDWLVVGNETPISAYDYFDLNKLKSEGFLGVKIIGSGIIIKFMEACYGLYPWNAFYEHDYLDKLLLTPNIKPANIIYEEKKKK